MIPLIAITASSPLHPRIMLGVFELAQELAFPGVTFDSGGNPKDGLIIQMWADLRTVPPLPICVMSVEGLKGESTDEGTGFETFGRRYPVNVMFLDREGWEDQKLLPVYMGWREQFVNLIENRSRLRAAREVVNLTVDEDSIVVPQKDEGSDKYNMVRSGFVVWATATVDRTKEVWNPC